MDENEEKIKFLVKLPDDDQDKILAYNEILDIIQDQISTTKNSRIPISSGHLRELPRMKVR